MNRIQKYALAAGAATTAVGAANAGDFYADLNNLSLFADGNGGTTLTATGLNSNFQIQIQAGFSTIGIGGASANRLFANAFGVNANMSMYRTNAGGVSRIAASAAINGSPWATNSIYSALLATTNGTASSRYAWAGPDGTTGFMGIRFDAGGGNYNYGWVEMTRTTRPGGFADLTLNSWFVNGTVNETVVAGQQGSNAVPGLGGLAALACGAAGVR
ncbi:MAG: hypothetical protein OSA40_02000, partial [Phycisphaerales bacterium]|nr:hypothetical protein [Phycisphaerales bacterium]